MAQRLLSVCLFVLLMGIVQKKCRAQKTHGDVLDSAGSNNDIGIPDGSSRNPAEAEDKENKTAEIQQKVTTEIPHSTLKPTPALIDTGSLSKKVYDDFNAAFIYIEFLLVFIGIFANICNIAVFTNKRMRCATSTILTFLSSSELGAAIFELIMIVCTVALGHRTYTSKVFWTLFQWIRIYLTIVSQRCSFCFNIMVAAERFIAVRFPLQSKQILRRRNPIAFCTVIAITIIGTTIFNPLKMEVIAINTRRGVIYMIQDSKLYINNPDVFEVMAMVTKILFSYIPLFGCLIMNILMILALWSHRKQHKDIHRNQDAEQNDRRQIQTTITILVSTFLFVLLALPVTTTSIIGSTNPEYGEQKKEHYLFRFLVQFNGLLYMLSLSMDFLVYMTLGRTFRQTFAYLFKSVFRRCRGPAISREGSANTRTDEMARSVRRNAETSLSAVKYEMDQHGERRSTTPDTVGSSLNVSDGSNASVNIQSMQ